jgi:hypothetical protein
VIVKTPADPQVYSWAVRGDAEGEAFGKYVPKAAKSMAACGANSSEQALEPAFGDS